MRCVGVCASLYENPVAVPRHFSPFQFARFDLSKSPQSVRRIARSGQVPPAQLRLPYRSWRPFRFTLTALATACANVQPEVQSRRFAAVSFDGTDPPRAPYGEEPSSGCRSIVSGPAATSQSANAAGWRTEVLPYETEWP